jgi:hypothetical protein
VSESVLYYADQGETLAAYRKSKKFFQCIMGPLGSAKTTTSIQKIIDLVTQQKPGPRGDRRTRGVVVRNTYPDLMNTTIRDFKGIVEPLRLGPMTMGHPPEMKMDFDLPDGTRVLAEIIFVALDKDDDVRKLRGMQLTWAYVNEMKEVPKSIIDMLQARVDRYPAQGSSAWTGIFGDTNAWDVDHWLEVIAQGVREGKYQDYEMFFQPGAVLKRDGKWVINPERENLQFIGPEYYLRQIEGKREDWIKVNLANEIGYYIDGRPVHPDYSDMVHGSPEELLPSPGVVYVGVDYGLTPAAAFMQKQPDGQWWVFDEIVTDDGDAASLAGEIKARCAEWDARLAAAKPGAVMAYSFKGDPSGDNRVQTDRRTPETIMRLNGVPISGASSNDPVIRRSALDRPLTRTVRGKPGILFSRRCRVIRKGLAGGFNYKRVAVDGGEGKYRDVPDKNKFSHVCEALEYGLMDAGEHAIVNPATPQKAAQRSVQKAMDWSPLNA